MSFQTCIFSSFLFSKDIGTMIENILKLFDVRNRLKLNLLITVMYNESVLTNAVGQTIRPCASLFLSLHKHMNEI